MNIKNILQDVSQYTELRFQNNYHNDIFILDGKVTYNSQKESSGCFARIFEKGVWGFAASPKSKSFSAEDLISNAQVNARLLSSCGKEKNIELSSQLFADIDCQYDLSTTKQKVSQEDKVNFLKELDEYIVSSCLKIKSRRLWFRSIDIEKNICTSENHEFYTFIPRYDIMIQLVAQDNDGNSFDLTEWIGDQSASQFEDKFCNPSLYFDIIDKQYAMLMEKIEGVYPDAGFADVVISGVVSGILAHEAVGHTVEADQVANGSIAADYMGSEVASPLVSLVDLAHTYNDKMLPVPVFIDDEGVKAQDVTIIEQGVLKSYLHSRLSAEQFKTAPTGNARVMDFGDEPMIRMRNTAILPGESKVEDMIQSIDSGYYFTHRGGGEADMTSEFMFGITMGYEIKNGKLGRAIKNTTISGVGFDVLKSVTMVSDTLEWFGWGTCGKRQMMIPAAEGGPDLKCRLKVGGR